MDLPGRESDAGPDTRDRQDPQLSREELYQYALDTAIDWIHDAQKQHRSVRGTWVDNAIRQLQKARELA